jgi:hypothetical protein
LPGIFFPLQSFPVTLQIFGTITNRTAQILNVVVLFSVADLKHFDADPDPACHFDADPDPSFLIMSLNLEKVLKYILDRHLQIVRIRVRTQIIHLMRIRIQLICLMHIWILPFNLMWIHADPDPQHWIIFYCVLVVNFTLKFEVERSLLKRSAKIHI